MSATATVVLIVTVAFAIVAVPWVLGVCAVLRQRQRERDERAEAAE